MSFTPDEIREISSKLKLKPSNILFVILFIIIILFISIFFIIFKINYKLNNLTKIVYLDYNKEYLSNNSYDILRKNISVNNNPSNMEVELNNFTNNNPTYLASFSNSNEPDELYNSLKGN